MTNILGFDISSLQGANIDFTKTKQSGYQFVIIRASIGNDGADRLCVSNVNAAKAAGLLVGIYNVTYSLRPDGGIHPFRDPIEQANQHWAFCQQFGIIATWQDVEQPEPSTWQLKGIDGEYCTDWILTYAQHYQDLSGIKLGLYTYAPYLAALGSPTSFADQFSSLWLACYGKQPPAPKPFGQYALLQNCGDARLPGVSPIVDTDICFDTSVFV